MDRRSLSLVTSIVLMLVMALATAVGAQAAGPKDKAKERAKHARIVNYWTPARLANAKPRDFVKKNGKFVPAARGGNKPSRPPRDPDDGGDTGDVTVTGAPWTQGGPALTGTGKVFFSMAGGNYVCSGATVDDGNRSAFSMVLTAGHCAFDETNGRFATNWMFIPEYDSSPTSTCLNNTEHGCFTAAALVVHRNYATAGGFNPQAIEHDWAFAVVGSGTQGGQLDVKVPDFGIGFDAVNEHRYSFGYPADGKYGGSDLVYCAGSVINDRSLDTWGLRCDMTPGSSGGPWMKDFDTGKNVGTLNSLNSYKYSGGKYKNYMFGPKFSSKTQRVYNAARSATSNTIVD